MMEVSVQEELLSTVMQKASGKSFMRIGKLSQRGIYIKSKRYSINEYGDTWEYYDAEGKSEYHLLGFDEC